MNDTLLRALLRQPVDYTPIWLMRQAGRYLPEYLATRKRAGSFMGLATSPALAAEVTMQPVDRFGMDAAILFSDILTVPDAMGLELFFVEGEGPKFRKPLRDEAAIEQLQPAPLERLQYVFDAVREVRKSLDAKGDQAVPLIGFSGSPFTLACYMVEGSGSHDDFRSVKALMYSRPDLFEKILSINATSVTAYLNAQIHAGAQAVMLFDTWGGLLAHEAYERFSLAWMRRIIDGLEREHDGARVPVIVFTKGGSPWLDAISQSGCDAVGLDWTSSLGKVRARIEDRCALQGNLDPSALFAPEPQLVREIERVLGDFGKHGAGTGHVFNLGHGISQFAPPEAVATLVQAVHRISPLYHAEVGQTR
ncbi:uroporphyrinogen decarboxylase [soil metagenome]